MIEIDPEDGALRVELLHGEAMTLEGLRPGAPVHRGAQRAVFLEPEQADTLRRMIDYNLGQITRGALKVRTGSDELLRAVLERLQETFGDTHPAP